MFTDKRKTVQNKTINCCECYKVPTGYLMVSNIPEFAQIKNPKWHTKMKWPYCGLHMELAKSLLSQETSMNFIKLFQPRLFDLNNQEIIW